jgi:hypothetical protein
MRRFAQLQWPSRGKPVSGIATFDHCDSLQRFTDPTAPESKGRSQSTPHPREASLMAAKTFLAIEPQGTSATALHSIPLGCRTVMSINLNQVVTKAHLKTKIMIVHFGVTTLCVVFATTNAFGQQSIDPPLKNWFAPLYWVPSQDTRGRDDQRETTAHNEPMQIPQATTSTIATASANAITGALVFVAITPCRVVDTREGLGFTGAFGPPALSGGVSRTFPIQSSTTCTIPTSALAYSLNITVVPSGPVGYLTAYATGQPLPPTAILNDVQGFIIGNAAIVAAGNSGSIDIYATNQTDLIIDINGYYTSPFSLPLAGTGDIAIGTNAGVNLVRGTNDIYIGNPGVAREDGVIRIGDLNNHRSTYIAGIFNSSIAGAFVQIDSSGHLGVVLSSGRYKEDIHDMLDASSNIMRLRPVTFRYKNPTDDGNKPLQYGLIAEEVAQVYPDLVVYGKDGQVETVQYQKLDVLLLNELQKQQQTIQDQVTKLEDQANRISALESLVRSFMKAQSGSREPEE